MICRLQIISLIILLPLFSLKAQNGSNEYKIDSLTKALKAEKDPFVKFELYRNLSFMDEEPKQYVGSMLLNAELSGSSDLQLRTYSHVAQIAGNDSAQYYVDKMFALAKEKKNEEFQGWYYLQSGQLQYDLKSNTAKAMELAKEANTIAVANNFDSLAFETNGFLAFLHNDRGESLLQYKSYMRQLSLAEKIGDGEIALGAYWAIFWFYNNLKQYSKAKECAFIILEIGKKKEWPSWVEGGHHLLTHYYTNVGEFETAKYYYDETNKLRKQNNNNVSEHDDLLDIYTMANDYVKLLGVLQKEDIKKSFIKRDSSGYDYYGQLAKCFTKLGMADSSFFYLQKMKEGIKKNEIKKWIYYVFLGDYYKLLNDADNAAINYNKADSIGGVGNNMNERLYRFANLDTLFSRNGNHERAYFYKTLWMQFRDSTTALSKEGELVAMEIEGESQRMEAEKRSRNNIQYMGITAGLASVFILLVLLGVFSSSTAIIKGISFFAFIFFFEFLILLFDNSIHSLTHGEPWKIHSIKIVLIAMLLPLHHYAERKVVNHLLNRKKIRLVRWKGAKPHITVPGENGNDEQVQESP